MDHSLPGPSVYGISQARVLEWVATSFSRGSSWPRDWTHVSCLAGRFFAIVPPGKPHIYIKYIVCIIMLHTIIVNIISNSLATWCEEPTHWKRPWCWERLRAGGEGGDRGWNGSKLQEIVKDKAAWDAVVHEAAKSWTRLSNWTTTATNKNIVHDNVMYAWLCQASGRLREVRSALSSLGAHTVLKATRYMPHDFKSWRLNLAPTSFSSLFIVHQPVLCLFSKTSAFLPGNLAVPGVPFTYPPSTNLIILQSFTQMLPLQTAVWLGCDGVWALSALSTSCVALSTLDLAAAITSVVSDSVRPHRLQPTRLPHPWDSPGKSPGVAAVAFSNAWKWIHSAMSDSVRPHGQQRTRLPRPWDSPGKSPGAAAVAFSVRLGTAAIIALVICRQAVSS